MSDNGMDSYADLATALGISAETVRRTVMGTLHSPAVLDWLRNHGQLEKHLCDPRHV
ncbi:MAG: hypothetical protein KH208_15390 [Desulfovibrio sp.]|nr:hypothetical protein [Desulfovibrio sp.]